MNAIQQFMIYFDNSPTLGVVLMCLGLYYLIDRVLAFLAYLWPDPPPDINYNPKANIKLTKP